MKRFRRLSRNRQEVLLDEDNRVIRDVLCIRCGVNLINLSTREGCPNCMHPVSDSVHGDYLIHTDPRQVRRLAEAARFVRLGALLLGVLVVLALLMTIATELIHRDFSRGISSVFRLLFAGAMIAPLLAAVGLCTLTNRRSFAYYQARFGNRAFINKVGLIGLAILMLLTIGFAAAPRLVTNLLLALWAAGPAAVFMQRLGQLMRRVPNVELAMFARMAFWGVIISGIALFCLRYLSVLAADHKGWRDAHLGVTALYIVVAVAFGVGAYRLLVAVERLLQKTAR